MANVFKKMDSAAGELAVVGAFFISITSLVNVSLFISDFKISVAIILLPIFAFLIEGFPLAMTSFLAAAGVFAVRVFTFYLVNANTRGTLAAYWPEMLFYIFYGLALAWYMKWYALRPYRLASAAPLALIDLASNVLELSVRIGPQNLSFSILVQLMIVAVCRMGVAAFIFFACDYYGLSVLRREDTKRYQRLLLLTSTLNSEIYWLKKSTLVIENTMSSAYRLYRELGESEDREHAEAAMMIAKDIHEVKKEYLLIIRGIADTMKMSTVEDGMQMKDILRILQSSLLRETGKQISITITCPYNFFTRKHYSLMSIFHNLMSNSIEAAGEGPGSIRLIQRDKGDCWSFVVRDNCGGIDPRYINEIFLPGFSSKINTATGEINRGLGLCLVKELVERQMGGTIEVDSADGFTTFSLLLPKQALEVE